MTSSSSMNGAQPVNVFNLSKEWHIQKACIRLSASFCVCGGGSRGSGEHACERLLNGAPTFNPKSTMYRIAVSLASYICYDIQYIVGISSDILKPTAIYLYHGTSKYGFKDEVANGITYFPAR